MRVYVLHHAVAFDFAEIVGVYATNLLAREGAEWHFESMVPSKKDRFTLGEWKSEGSDVAYFLYKEWPGYYKGGEESDEWYSIDSYVVVEA